MLGLPNEGAVNCFYDNEYVYRNTSLDEYQPKK